MYPIIFNNLLFYNIVGKGFFLLVWRRNCKFWGTVVLYIAQNCFFRGTRMYFMSHKIVVKKYMMDCIPKGFWKPIFSLWTSTDHNSVSAKAPFCKTPSHFLHNNYSLVFIILYYSHSIIPSAITFQICILIKAKGKT